MYRALCAFQGSNLGPFEYQSNALPAELNAHKKKYIGENRSDITKRESLEFSSLATDENQFSSVDSLGNITKIT